MRVSKYGKGTGKPLSEAVHSHAALQPLRWIVERGRNRRSDLQVAYLARVLPGELKVVPVTLDQQGPDWRIYLAGSADALTFFSRLVHGKYDGLGDPPQADFIFNSMFDLLKHGADQLAPTL